MIILFDQSIYRFIYWMILIFLMCRQLMTFLKILLILIAILTSYINTCIMIYLYWIGFTIQKWIVYIWIVYGLGCEINWRFIFSQFGWCKMELLFSCFEKSKRIFLLCYHFNWIIIYLIFILSKKFFFLIGNMTYLL